MPFSQIMEVSGAGEDGDCQVEVEVTGFQWETAGDGREIELTLELLSQAQVRGRRSITLLQDLYSTGYQMETDTQLQPLCRLWEQSVRPRPSGSWWRRGRWCARWWTPPDHGKGGAEPGGG